VLGARRSNSPAHPPATKPRRSRVRAQIDDDRNFPDGARRVTIANWQSVDFISDKQAIKQQQIS